MYYWYTKRPSRPIDGYVLKLQKHFGITVSNSLVSRWFHSIGPFKGTMRLTSKFPPAKNTWMSEELVHQFLSFIVKVDHRKLVFADEKPMKGVDIYDRVRRDPFTGNVPSLTCDANSKNRYNIFAAITIKRHDKHIHFEVLEEHGDAILFAEFTKILMRSGILVQGDIFVVDNCTIHVKGDNEALQKILWEDHGILMITLPPYHPELNPTELVFSTLVTRMRSQRARVGSNDFLGDVNRTLDAISRRDVISFFQECGYYKYR